MKTVPFVVFKVMPPFTPVPGRFRYQPVTVLTAVVITMGMLLIGCSQEPPPIRVMINPWPAYEFLYLAQEKGFFQQEGVHVELIELDSWVQIHGAYERGQIDVVTCTPTEFIHMRLRSSRPAQIIYVLDESNADVILAKEPIARVADLRGKRVAIEPDSVNLFVLARALELDGLTLDDVEVVETDPYRVEQVLERDEADAVVTYPPFSFNVLAGDNVKEIFSSRQIPGEVVDVLCVDQEVLAARSQDAARIIRAYDRAVDYASQHPDEAYGIMSSREGISIEEFRRVIEQDIRIIRLDEQSPLLADGGSLERVIQNAVEIMRSIGQIDGAVIAKHCIAREPAAAAMRP